MHRTAQFPNALGTTSVEDSVCFGEEDYCQEEAKTLYEKLAMEEGNKVAGNAEQTPLASEDEEQDLMSQLLLCLMPLPRVRVTTY